MSNLLKSLNEKPIGFYRVYKRLTGNTNAALLLSQLMYWFSHKDKFYKTDSDIMEETELTKKELETAKIKLKKLPFIEVTREGIPAKTYYTINWEKYEKTLRDFVGGNKFPQKGETVENTDDGEDNIPQIEAEDENGETSFPKRGKLDSTKGGNKSLQNGETINVIQKTSSKTTSKNTLSPKSSLTKKQINPQREDFKKFRERILKLYKGLDLVKGAKGFLPEVIISVSQAGYLHNQYNNKDLDRDDAIIIWNWLYENQNQLLPLPSPAELAKTISKAM
ncbi:MAG: hypothetical protein PHS85_01945 [Sulfurovum sp.]|nr:hypothetical protein [Sulfurovum sp.]MDD3499100.1 hypothetical protein [Sulfurovum sp.]